MRNTICRRIHMARGVSRKGYRASITRTGLLRIRCTVCLWVKLDAAHAVLRAPHGAGPPLVKTP